MKVGNDILKNAAVYLWSKQKRLKDVPISALILQEKSV